MFNFIANIFGYLLNFIYNLFNNYGLAIIIFSILVKLILLPLTIKQQKTMEKTNKMQEELKSLQFKYKNDPEKLNKEMMDMYKRENMSPFSGCLSSIIQLILILAVFLKNLASNYYVFLNLASGGVYMDHICRQICGELLPRLFILTIPLRGIAVYFCCTFLLVT